MPVFRVRRLLSVSPDMVERFEGAAFAGEDGPGPERALCRLHRHASRQRRAGAGRGRPCRPGPPAAEGRMTRNAALVAAIPVVFGDRMNLAHDAVLAFAAECGPDRWPSVPTILRFAACYQVRARDGCLRPATRRRLPRDSRGAFCTRHGGSGRGVARGNGPGPWSSLPNRLIFLGRMVLRERIELSTSPLPRECSTTELPQRRAGWLDPATAD